jgi:hypothetical protein
VALSGLFRQGCFPARRSTAGFALPSVGNGAPTPYVPPAARRDNLLRIGARGNDRQYIPTDGNTDVNTNNENDATQPLQSSAAEATSAFHQEVLFKLNLANPISRRSLF